MSKEDMIDAEQFDTSAAPSQAVDELTATKESLSLAEEQLMQMKEQVMRIEANSRNMIARSERELERYRQTALKDFVKALLPVLDSFDQGLAVEADDADAKKGLQLTFDMLLSTLEKFGVERLNPVGEVFNPEFHEAISMVESPGSEPNSVLEVMQKGYLLNQNLIRAARVVVVKVEN